MNALALNLLTLAVSGATGLVVTLIFRQIGTIAKDVKEIRDTVGKHGERLATVEAKLEALDKHGCSTRRECLRLVKSGDPL